MTTETLPQKQVFHCDNLTLAIALSALGCQFANENGVAIKGLNKYTMAFIRSHALAEKTKGMSHEDAVRYLWRNGQPGNIVYCFERSAVLTAICEGWDEQGAAVDEDSEIAADPKDAGRIARRLAQTRTQFIGDKATVPHWRARDAKGNLFVPAIAHTTGTSSSEATGDKASRTVIRDARMKAVEV